MGCTLARSKSILAKKASVLWSGAGGAAVPGGAGPAASHDSVPANLSTLARPRAPLHEAPEPTHDFRSAHSPDQQRRSGAIFNFLSSKLITRLITCKSFSQLQFLVMAKERGVSQKGSTDRGGVVEEQKQHSLKTVFCVII